MNLNHRLILIEGIPGSGKSTLAKNIYQLLQSMNIKTNQYSEGEFHPADLAWIAYLTKEQYDLLLQKYETMKEEIVKHTRIEEDRFLVEYTKIRTNNFEFYQDYESYEIFNNRVTKDEFININLKRWENFFQDAKNKNEVNIFECSFFQNHVSELLLFYEYSQDEIIKHLLTLLEKVRKLNPLLIYLKQKDTRKTIEKVSEERLDSKGNKWWEQAMIESIEISPYAKNNHLKGLEGAIKFFEARKEIEKEALKKLNIKILEIDNSSYDFEKMTKETLKCIEEIYKRSNF